ncbi:cysteine-rich KTR domain-containing protein [Pseudoramibacter faecis]|uniref:cysteine-rich KTR domain-containing protein n=1 Tax=Pseudoramibacter faecis TaxID=3108534 RepID=UPI002E762798|nr:cysteine-rich KTR domain-containing protein [Pseudoramibacter sp. HA2172]
MAEQKKRVICPVCGRKTRIKIHKDTVLINFPLFCPKCRKETLIDLKQGNIIIKGPDAKTQSR